MKMRIKGNTATVRRDQGEAMKKMIEKKKCCEEETEKSVEMVGTEKMTENQRGERDMRRTGGRGFPVMRKKGKEIAGRKKRKGAKEIKGAAGRVWIPPVKTVTPLVIPAPAVLMIPQVTALLPLLHPRGKGNTQTLRVRT